MISSDLVTITASMGLTFSRLNGIDVFREFWSQRDVLLIRLFDPRDFIEQVARF